MEITKKQKEAVEELRKKAVFCNYEERDYPNMICFKKDLLIVLNLIEKLQKENELLRKDIEGWKKYCEEIQEEQTEVSNKNCELEFEVEKLQKENDKLKKSNQCYINSIQAITPVLAQDYVSKQEIKDKIEKLNKKEKEELKGMKGQDRYFVKQTYQNKRMILQELIEESE